MVLETLALHSHRSHSGRSGTCPCAVMSGHGSDKEWLEVSTPACDCAVLASWHQGLQGIHGIGAGWKGALSLAWDSGSREELHCEDEVTTSSPGGWWLGFDKTDMLGGLNWKAKMKTVVGILTRSFSSVPIWEGHGGPLATWRWRRPSLCTADTWLMKIKAEVYLMQPVGCVLLWWQRPDVFDGWLDAQVLLIGLVRSFFCQNDFYGRGRAAMTMDVKSPWQAPGYLPSGWAGMRMVQRCLHSEPFRAGSLDCWTMLGKEELGL